MSCVTCHVSCVTSHVSHVTFYFFLTKCWSLLVEGLFLTGPTLCSFFRKYNTRDLICIMCQWSHAVLLNCTRLHCSDLHWTADFSHTLHPTAPTCTAFCALDCTAPTCRICRVESYIAPHWTALRCTALHCTAQNCTAMHFTALHCTALHYNTHNCTPLNYTEQDFIAQH